MEVKNGCQKLNNTNIESSVTTIGLYLQQLVVKAGTIKSNEFWVSEEWRQTSNTHP